MKILICGREAEIDERTSSDNCDLDLEIAEILGLTEDQVDEIALETVELLRETLWRLQIRRIQYSKDWSVHHA
tara:strand:+ start:508 stop:726 length:219 start_codon:yes stop_codon:yes gene_type:complete